MYANSLKNIAVLATELHGEFADSLCRSICNRAKELNYNIAIFSWDNPQGQNESYIFGESNIFNLPDYNEFDAVIYLKDTFMSDDVEKMIEDTLIKDFKGIKVSIRCKMEGFYNILVDDAPGIVSVIDHLVNEHGLTRIAYMSGKKDMLDAQIRLAAYKETMDKYGLKYDDSYIFHGDYWNGKAVPACDQFLNSPLGVPEAIVCANDYMALSIKDELVQRKYKIPDDIRITGFDNIHDSRVSVPSLTTVDVPIAKLGESAVDMIDNILNNREQEEVVYVAAEPIFRRSCGCDVDDLWEHINMHTSTNIAKNTAKRNLVGLRFMLVALEGALSLDKVSDVVDNYMYLNSTYKNFFLCLTRKDEDTDYNTVSSMRKGYSKKSLCALAIIEKGHTSDYPLVFETKYLVPPIYVDETPQSYCFMPLHYLDMNYGYAAVNYYDYGRMEQEYSTFITQISSALDSVYNKTKLQKTLNEVEKLYVMDPLTKLFNRRGYEKNANIIFEECKQDNKPVMIMIVDMDNMKYINDNFGHMQGDIAIQILGKALKHASSGKEICARVGGDEFNVIAGDYSDEEYGRFVAAVLDYLDGFNEVNELNYKVNVSYGGIIVRHFGVGNLEYYTNIADNLMYEQKATKKNRRM